METFTLVNVLYCIPVDIAEWCECWETLSTTEKNEKRVLDSAHWLSIT